ncbi:LCP family protein [Streptacidiphilus carbonis]|uniref:LCP family protein n=1 Tax=Streptacidiphilus carbonis TaxID=105422 RepID=UPI0005A607AD|nr:LCP family protein [Streptacidiphilus carbonis]
MSDTSTGGRAAARRGGGSPSQGRGGAPGSPDPSGPPSGGRAALRKAAKKGRKKKPLKVIAISTAGVVTVALVGGVYAYEKLNGNIKSDALFAGTSGNAGTEKVDAFGRSPINMLVIGSDIRANAADCNLGGDCASGTGGGDGNADVEMVVHISADRSNATVMSVPRDLMTNLPACKDDKTGASTNGGYGMINSALQYGPGCSVAAIHQLTNIPIDHFAMVDFSGVVAMSDAVGGVNVCVSNNVYDPQSHLKLSKGTHTLKGTAALEFVRTRHGFGNGGDVGRTAAQHLFLTAMINQMKSAGTLTSPTKLWSLANAATKALTVDTGLNSIPKLIGLGEDLNKVPTDRITFTTMQTGDDPTNANRLVIAAGAQTLFSTIANDQSLTTSSGAKSSAAGATAKAAASAPAVETSKAPAAPTKSALAPADVAVHVANGTTAQGHAGDVVKALISDGYASNSSTENPPSSHVKTTTLTYGPGRQADAQEVATSLGLPSSALKQGTSSGIHLLIGADWPSGNTFPGGKSSAPPANTKVALSNANVQTGNQTSTCAQVGTQDTVSLPGYGGMTPIRAYTLSPKVKDSAP